MSAAAARSSLLRAVPPAIGVEITADRLAIVSVERSRGGTVVNAHGVERLAPGLVTPLLNGKNIHDTSVLADTLRHAIVQSGIRGTRAAVVVPDAIARVSIVSFESVPATRDDLAQLIRWQVRKSVPFPIDAAQVSWQRAAGNDFIVTVARRDVIEEYETVCTRAGLQAGIVDIATFNLVNAVLASGAVPKGDWLLVHLTPADATIAVLRGEHLIFFRNKATALDETVEDLIHQTAMYHEDRLGGGRFARVVVAGLAATASPDARRNIEARFGVAVEAVDPRGAASLRDRIAAGPELLEALAAPVGALAREVA